MSLVCWTCSLEVNICPHGILPFRTSLHSTEVLPGALPKPLTSLQGNEASEPRRIWRQGRATHSAYSNSMVLRTSVKLWHPCLHLLLGALLWLNLQLRVACLCPNTCNCKYKTSLHTFMHMDGCMDTFCLYPWLMRVHMSAFKRKNSFWPRKSRVSISHDRQEGNLARLAHQARLSSCQVTSPVHLMQCLFPNLTIPTE